MVVIGATNAESAFFSENTAVDWNVVFLLIGMMIIIGVLKQTGLFEYLAIWAAKRARGRPFAIMAMLCTITAGRLRPAPQRHDRDARRARHAPRM